MTSSLLQKNLHALEKHHPLLAERIRGLPDIPGLSLVTREGNAVNLALQSAEGKAQPYYPDESPRYSKTLIDQLALKNPRVLIFLGLGLGHHLLEYARRPHPLNQGIIIIEAFPEIFKKTLEAVDLTPLMESARITWQIGADLEVLRQGLGQFFSQGSLRYANAVEYIALPPALQINQNFFKQVEQIIPQAIAHQFNRVFGDPYDGYLATLNIMENLPRVLGMPGLEQAKGLFANKPGIVIASGPSLPHCFPMLRDLQDCSVMAVSPSALKEVIQQKIHPHIWLDIERLEEDANFLASLPSKPPHLFVGPPRIHPKTFASHAGDNCYLLSANLQSNWLPLPGNRYDLGHSSAHTAFLALHLLGCDPIFLVGQDLSYAASGSHAPGVWEESKNLMMNMKDDPNRTLTIEGNNGQPVATNLFWLTYLKTFSEQLIPNHQGTVYNVIPEDCGAKIPGTIRINPEQFLQKIAPKPFPALTLLKEKLTPPSPEETQQRTSIIKERAQQAIRMLDRLIQDSEQFSLQCKDLQFHPELMRKNWQHVEPLYRKFLDEVERYSTRYTQDPSYEQNRFHYQEFFHPIIQGLMLRYQIDFFSSAEDLSGNFQEISRKTEVLFNMAKDEAHWARLCLPILHRCLQVTSKN